MFSRLKDFSRVLIKVIALSVTGFLLANKYPSDKVVFFDVGVGDSSLIQIDGKNILVDGGPDDSVIYRLGKYLAGVNPHIDLIILSHFHKDHYEGLNDVLQRYEVEEVWIPNVCDRSIIQRQFFSGDTPITQIPTARGYGAGGGTLEVRLPAVSNGSCVHEKNANNGSLVVALDTDQKDIYFFGDIEKETEQKMLRDEILGKANIIKAAHHCSETSSTEDLLKIVDPEVAICSTGRDNWYGHPSKSVLSRFSNLGITYKITYEEGDIVISL